MITNISSHSISTTFGTSKPPRLRWPSGRPVRPGFVNAQPGVDLIKVITDALKAFASRVKR